LRSHTVRDLRNGNRARVLRFMLQSGRTTRAEIARNCHLSVATAGTVTADLLAEGLVTETGTIPSDGGRPVAELCPVPDSAFVMGADIGEAGVTVELFDLTLRRRDRAFIEVAESQSTPANVSAALSAAVELLHERNSFADSSLLGIGLGLPGVVEIAPDGTETVFAQSMGWLGTSVRDLLPDAKVTVHAENGANTLALAEMWLGAARGVQDGVVVLVGRGLGAGIISGGRTFRGSSGGAGEWGHTKISSGGPQCRCGRRGCLEAYIGGDALVRRWLATGATAPTTYGEALEALLSRADEGDGPARRIADEAVELLSLGLSNLVNLLNPERVVVGGWAGLSLLAARGAQITERVRLECLDRPGEQVSLVPSHLGGDGVALGAALLPLELLIEGPRRVGAPV
jgi:predicted NBD/HSP70 family sugar kinase